jgi:hypothetical protein
MTKRRIPAGLAILLVSAGLFYAVFIGRSAFHAGGRLFFTLIDDAMISMRYAQHLAAGRGLVWNVGEAPVEGFTNLGWMLVMTVFHLLPVPQADISLAVMITSAVILLLNVIVVHRIAQLLLPIARLAPLIAAAMTAFYFPLVFWSLRGMEVGLLTLLVDLAALQAIRGQLEQRRNTVVLALLLVAMLLVRLDAAPQTLLILLYVLSAAGIARSQKLALTLLIAAVVVAILAFQFAYFGDALPNTYYQKMLGASIGERLRVGALAFIQYATRDVVLLVLFSAVGLWLHPEVRSRETALLAGLFGIQCLYSIWVGGDYAEPEVSAANRFITQGMPALILLFCVSIGHVTGSRRTTAGGKVSPEARPAAVLLPMAIALVALMVASGPPWLNWIEGDVPLLRADIRRVRAGLAIAGNTSPEATIAVHAAGQIPYYSGRRTIDLLGLSDPVIAKGPRSTAFYPGHDKWNYEYSIGQLQPDLIADNWIRLGDYIRTRPEYLKLENGMYVRIDTTLVDQAGLESAYP